MSDPKEEISSCTSLFRVNKAFDFTGTTSTNKDSLGKHQNNPPCQNSSFSYILMSEPHKKVKSKERNNQTNKLNKTNKQKQKNPPHYVCRQVDCQNARITTAINSGQHYCSANYQVVPTSCIKKRQQVLYLSPLQLRLLS